jgi:glutaredoxin
MKVIYYKSIICPKCIPTNRLIKQLKREHPHIPVEEIEIITHMSRAKRDGVKHVPTIIAGEKRCYAAPAMEELLAAVQQASEPLFG